MRNAYVLNSLVLNADRFSLEFDLKCEQRSKLPVVEKHQASLRAAKEAD